MKHFEIQNPFTANGVFVNVGSDVVTKIVSELKNIVGCKLPDTNDQSIINTKIINNLFTYFGCTLKKSKSKSITSNYRMFTVLKAFQYLPESERKNHCFNDLPVIYVNLE